MTLRAGLKKINHSNAYIFVLLTHDLVPTTIKIQINYLQWQQIAAEIQESILQRSSLSEQ